jgi:hypothetical protein
MQNKVVEKKNIINNKLIAKKKFSMLYMPLMKKKIIKK